MNTLQKNVFLILILTFLHTNFSKNVFAQSEKRQVEYKALEIITPEKIPDVERENAKKVSNDTCLLKGMIIDELTKEPIIQAIIAIKGTNIGTLTDENGKFTLKNVPQNCTLQITNYDYETFEILADYKFFNSWEENNQQIYLKPKEDNVRILEGYKVNVSPLPLNIPGIDGQIITNLPITAIQYDINYKKPNFFKRTKRTWDFIISPFRRE